MKIIHWAAIAVLTLLTLMNLGALLGGTSAGVLAIGIVLGIAGIVAIVGLVRRTPWGRNAALAVGALNVVSALIGLIAGWEGWQIGLGVSVVSLILTAVGESRTQHQLRTAADR